MLIRARRFAVIACIALQAGCWTVPRPYHKDPLIKNEKRQRGDFDQPGELLLGKPPEPAAPSAPPGVPEWVKSTSAGD